MSYIEESKEDLFSMRNNVFAYIINQLTSGFTVSEPILRYLESTYPVDAGLAELIAKSRKNLSL